MGIQQEEKQNKKSIEEWHKTMYSDEERRADNTDDLVARRANDIYNTMELEEEWKKNYHTWLMCDVYVQRYELEQGAM